MKLYYLKLNHNFPFSVRRFPSLGFLRRKRSTSSSDLAHRSDASGNGHSASNSHSSNSSQNQNPQSQPQSQAPPQEQLTRPVHITPAPDASPSLPESSKPELISTSRSTNNGSSLSFARPPKPNMVPRTSISLYETSEARPHHSRITKRAIILPSSKTMVVARTPCTYDVTTVRPQRPRSNSLPLDSMPQKAVATSNTSHSEDVHTRSSYSTEAKEDHAAKAHGSIKLHSRPLNTSTSLTDLSSSYALSPSAQGAATPGAPMSYSTPRTPNRYATVYRPSPSLADGYAQAGHPKPALSLTLPTSVSIMQPSPLSSTAMPVSKAASATSTSSGQTPRHDPLSSPYTKLFHSSVTSSSPMASPRPPPRAPIPESPEASPDKRNKPLPVLPDLGSFSATSSPVVASPLQNHNGLAPWARPRAHSSAKLSTMPSSWTRDRRKSLIASQDHLNSAKVMSASPKSIRANLDGANDARADSPKISHHKSNSNIRTVYTNTPTIPISNQRRPSLPITPTTAEFAHQITDLDEILWGYFERSGLAPSSKQPREIWRSRSSTTLSQDASNYNGLGPSLNQDINIMTPPLFTVPRVRKGSGGGVNMRKSVHSVYASSPSGAGSQTPQTSSSGSPQTSPLLTGTSSGSSYQPRRVPPPATAAASAVHKADASPAPSIKLSGKQTIILREPPSSRLLRGQRPTHLISHSLPTRKADLSPAIVDNEVTFLEAAHSRGVHSHSPGFFPSPYPSPGLTFPVTPVTPSIPWVRGGSDSPVIPPSP